MALEASERPGQSRLPTDPDVVTGADMGGGAHDDDAVVVGLARHRPRVGQVLGPVIQRGEQMAMEVDHAGPAHDA